MRPLEDYLAEHRTLGHDQFVANHAPPVLVHRRDGDVEGAGRMFKTTAVDAQTVTSMLRKSSAGEYGEYCVWQVLKKTGGTFADRVSVGRTRAADVCLDYPQVSKFHAYFKQSDGQLFITDAGATNGTFVNAQRLSPNEPRKMEDGVLVSFGAHTFTFYLAAGFAEFLRRMARR